VGGRTELGAEENLRIGNPILSLFGAATPRIAGRLVIEPAIGHLPIGDKSNLGMDLPEGVRRDPFRADSNLIEILSKADIERWSRQHSVVSRKSIANRKLEDARRALSRARKTEGVEIADFEMELANALDEVDALVKDEDYTLAVQRPLPAKHATAAGTVFDHCIELRDASLEEIGLFFTTLASWSLDPRVGGSRTTGYGRIETSYSIEILTDEEPYHLGRWQPIGTLGIGAGGMELDCTHPIVTNALAAWAAAENDILNSRVIK